MSLVVRTQVTLAETGGSQFQTSTKTEDEAALGAEGPGVLLRWRSFAEQRVMSDLLRVRNALLVLDAVEGCLEQTLGLAARAELRPDALLNAELERCLSALGEIHARAQAEGGASPEDGMFSFELPLSADHPDAFEQLEVELVDLNAALFGGEGLGDLDFARPEAASAARAAVGGLRAAAAANRKALLGLGLRLEHVLLAFANARRAEEGPGATADTQAEPNVDRLRSEMQQAASGASHARAHRFARAMMLLEVL